MKSSSYTSDRIVTARHRIAIAAKILETFAIDSNRAFVDAYIAAGGRNGVFNFPDGIHSWGYAGQQLLQMRPDIQRTLGAVPGARQ